MQQGHGGQPGDGYYSAAGAPAFPQQGASMHLGSHHGHLLPGEAQAGGQHAYAAAGVQPGAGHPYGGGYAQGYDGPGAHDVRAAQQLHGGPSHSAAGGPSAAGPLA